MGWVKEAIRLTSPYFFLKAVLGALLGAVLSLGALPDATFLLGAASLVFLTAGFNSFNATYDFNADFINKPHRPLPRGTLSIQTAFLLAMAFYVSALSTAFFVNQTFFLVVLFGSVLTISYSFKGIGLKRRFVIGSLSASGYYSVICVLAGWAMYPSAEIPVYLISYLFVLGTAIGVIKDFHDYYGDKIDKVRSLPIVLGFERSFLIVKSILVVSFFLLFFYVALGLVESKFLIANFAPLFMLIAMPTFYKAREKKVFFQILGIWALLKISLILVALY